ncbi:MAG: PIN domain-containing protein [archaeon]
MNKYYVDSCIWRDYYENRTDKYRPLGVWAFEFFKRAVENKDTILYSEFIVNELSHFFEKEIIKDIFSIVSEEGILKKIEITDIHKKEAVKLHKKLKIPFGDAMHTILARDQAAILISRDHHFEEIEGIVEINKPEDLI